MDSPTNLVSLPLYDAITACTACNLRQEARRPIPPEGCIQSPVLFLGQNPGEDEEKAGRVFIGRAGKEFDDWFTVLRMDRTKVAVGNIVHCHTTKNRTPRVGEVRFCRDAWLPSLLRAMPQLRVIIPMGKPAQSAVLTRIAVPLMEFFVGTVRWEEREFTVYPIVHPAYILRSPQERGRQHGVLRQVRDHFAANLPEAFTYVT